MTLILDQESPVISYELFSSNILWPRSFTFIGHLPVQYRLVILIYSKVFMVQLRK